MRHDPCRVCPLLDLAIEPAAIDCERDPAGEIFGEGEIVRTVGLAGLRSCERQRSECPLPCRERNADGRPCIDSPENRGLLPSTRGLAESRNDLETSRLDDRAHGFVWLLSGSSGGFLAQELGPRNRNPLERAPVLDDVDDAPIGVVSNRLLGDPLDCAPIVERRGEDLARLAHEVEAPLPVHGTSRRLALGRQQSFALFLRPLALADVDEQGLRVHRLSLGAANRRDLFSHPNDASATSKQAIFGLSRRLAGRLLLGAGENLVPVVRVKELGVELRILLPLSRRIAEQRFDLRADV